MKIPRLITIFTVACASAVTAFACVAPDESTELAERLGLELTNIKPLDDPLDSAEVRRIEEVLGNAIEYTKTARLYSANLGLSPGAPQILKIVVLPLSEKLSGAALTIAVKSDGQVVNAHVGGIELFDHDPDRDWQFFLSQFERQEAMNAAMNPFDAASKLDLDAAIASLESSTDDSAKAAKALYKLRLIMRDHSYRFTRMGARRKRGEMPKSAWLLSWERSFDKLGKLSEEIAGVIGDEAAAQFREIAAKGGPMLRESATAAKENDVPTLARIMGGQLYRNVCQTCHHIDTHKLGGATLSKALGARLDEFSVRGDLARVGFDVWHVPGKRKESQQLATAMKAGLLVLGACD